MQQLINGREKLQDFGRFLRDTHQGDPLEYANNYHLQRFDSRNPPPTAELVRMHCELLPSSPAVRFGPLFMKEVFYSRLPEMGSVFGAVAMIGGEHAAFVSATDDSAGFMSQALRRHFIRVVGSVAKSIAARPTRVSAVFEVIRLMRHRGWQDDNQPQGEILSMGVRPAYRQPQFVAESQLSIAQDLLDHAVSAIRKKGRTRIRAVVDADNIAAQMLYWGSGWHLERARVPGWTVPSVEFVVEI
jgi:ribosomal protein S18 acetylase RimI-like enzyme